MAIELENGAGRDRQVVEAIAAFIGDAEYMAELVHRFLTNCFKGLGLPIYEHCLPAEFLLELAAVIRIAQWQRAGLVDAMGEKFLPWQDLLRQLIRRLMEEPLSFSFDPKACSAPLCRRVVGVWFHRCSWSAVREIAVDVIVHPLAAYDMLSAVADLLWKYRRLSRRDHENG
jgi:hypothetical protein